MGLFSWMFADTDNKENLRIHKEAQVPCPDGKVIICSSYNGYGSFGGHDIYELVANWNRKYLASHPEHGIPSKIDYLKGHPDYKDKRTKVSEMAWYPYYANLSLSPAEVVEQTKSACNWEFFEYRQIGIDIACYDEDNEALPYPIKICKNANGGYDSFPASKSDPEQGYPIA